MESNGGRALNSLGGVKAYRSLSNSECLERRQYKSLEELIQNELEELVFDNLISASEEELESIHIFNGDPASQENYRLLSRLKADCDYFLGAGKRAEKHL